MRRFRTEPAKVLLDILAGKGKGHTPGVVDRQSLLPSSWLEFEEDQVKGALIETNDRWNAVLPDVIPLIGGTYCDYVSENFSEV